MSTDKRLKIYVISSHVDKPLTENVTKSIYECQIQAGAALTDKRICELNDLDDCNSSLSLLNSRYGEASAMYWIGQHTSTPYVGIAHYRRRLQLTDEQYSDLMDQEIDIITTVPVVYNGYTIESLYRAEHYSADWDVFESVLREKDPEDYAFDMDAFHSNEFHSCNLNVFRSDIYKEYYEWAFPILKEVFVRIPEKRDIYQHRDIAFLSERLSHLFIKKQKAAGKAIVEVPITELSSKKWKASDECVLSDRTALYEACSRLFESRQLNKLHILIYDSIQYYSDDELMNTLFRACTVAILERRSISHTMYEYLPDGFLSNLDTFLEIWNSFESAVGLHVSINNEQSNEALKDFINLTHFSELAVDTVTGWFLQQQGLS